MDIQTLEKANALNQKIREFTEALNCFEWENGGKKYSTNPRLIIEYDGDGREKQKLPMARDALIAFLKAEILKGREVVVKEFNNL